MADYKSTHTGEQIDTVLDNTNAGIFGNVKGINTSNGSLTVEKFKYGTKYVELDAYYLYLVIPWSASPLNIVVKWTDDDGVEQSEVYKLSKTNFNITFINYWHNENNPLHIALTTSTYNNDGVVINKRYPNTPTVYLQQSLGMPNTGLRMKW